MAKLELICACGQVHTFRCNEDDSTKQLAEDHGWLATDKGWTCPQCVRKAEAAK